MDEAINFLKIKIEEYSLSLPISDSTQIKSFLSHDEYEMAFEGLVLELIRQNIHPQQKDIDLWVSSGRIFYLEKNFNFDEDFMVKMEHWIHDSK